MDAEVVTRTGETFDTVEEAARVLSLRSRRGKIARIIDPDAFNERHPHQASKEAAFDKADEILEALK